MEEKTHYDKILDKLKNFKLLVYLFFIYLIIYYGSGLLQNIDDGNKAFKSLTGSSEVQKTIPAPNIVGNDNNVIIGNNNTIIVEKDNVSDEKPDNNRIDKKEIKPLHKNIKRIEIPIQINRKLQGFHEIFLDGKKVQPLATSTPLNPRILIKSNSNKSRQILITTKSGDTCQLNGLFYDGMEKPVFRFIPDCKI